MDFRFSSRVRRPVEDSILSRSCCIQHPNQLQSKINNGNRLLFFSSSLSLAPHCCCCSNRFICVSRSCQMTRFERDHLSYFSFLFLLPPRSMRVFTGRVDRTRSCHTAVYQHRTEYRFLSLFFPRRRFIHRSYVFNLADSEESQTTIIYILIAVNNMPCQREMIPNLLRG